ncbi:MAG: hypothetical protein IKY52_08045 [Clostridia bacterium]|nr:hypothetical protein [Clostridia bacterium]
MRWMKKLLLSIYLYMGIFFGICLILWIVTGEEPSALIMGISAAVGVESVAAGVIRIYENKETYKHEKEMQNGKQDQLESEADQP